MSTIRYDVAMVSEQNGAICWQACAAMVIQFKRGYTPSAEDLAVPVEAESYSDISEALSRLGFVLTRSTAIRDPHKRALLPARQTHQVVTPPEPDESVIYSLLNEHGPFILNRCGEAHSVVITGVDTSRRTVYFNDPFGGRDVPAAASSITAAMRRYESAGGRSIAYL
jgi:hypothetical protein